PFGRRPGMKENQAVTALAREAEVVRMSVRELAHESGSSEQPLACRSLVEELEIVVGERLETDEIELQTCVRAGGDLDALLERGAMLDQPVGAGLEEPGDVPQAAALGPLEELRQVAQRMLIGEHERVRPGKVLGEVRDLAEDRGHGLGIGALVVVAAHG